MQRTYALQTIWRRQWHPTPVLLPGKSHGWRSLVGCRPWGREESDTTERLHFHFIVMHWRRKWQPTPVFLPGESQGRQSLVGRHLWGRTELDTTEATEQQQPVQETLVPSLCRKDPLEKEMATHSSISAWEIPWTEEPSGL